MSHRACRERPKSQVLHQHLIFKRSSSACTVHCNFYWVYPQLPKWHGHIVLPFARLTLTSPVFRFGLIFFNFLLLPSSFTKFNLGSTAPPPKRTVGDCRKFTPEVWLATWWGLVDVWTCGVGSRIDILFSRSYHWGEIIVTRKSFW